MSNAYTSKARRQFQDVFDKVASGFATSAGTAISSGAQQTLAVTIPDVAVGTWSVIAIQPASTLSGVTLTAEVTAAGTVTVYLQNLTGSSQTPAAQQITVVAAQISSQYTQGQ